ncbi:TetR/AcrR family transcriptional regulator [Amycolatopsis suaedae]|uniref:TetR family transcriptional regulator n=1 Tax=Amycolatopsis suaedae TaxID=2510978 RepID=A0A4Q7JDL1_9PSEU|nr:TetR family transcriptional regulator C-terminal domain-containing protein [Amycolatopsis suaedae]RZQ65981.1 TetR family transcriptional regulator [Amycolatopsis suaedae]
MPKTVDHAERRAHIIDALVRLAGRVGLHEVTMRSVAAEAGVSLRLVQYYFETKAGLLHTALLRLEEQSMARWAERLDQPTPRRAVEELLAEALPTDERSRAFHLMWTSYAVLAMTDADLARQPFVDGPKRLEAQLAELLRGARLADGRDPDTEAARLLALSHGLGTSVLIGHRSADSAAEILAYHVDQVLPR